MSEELLACFNREGNELTPQPRRVALAQPFPEYYHAVVNIWVVDKDANILCSLRSGKVAGNPNKWQTYFGGHVTAGMPFEETAIKELQEESEVNINLKELILTEEGVYEPHKHFFKNYILKTNPENLALNFTDGEIAETKWFSFNDYKKDSNLSPEKWCNGLEAESFKNIQIILKNLL